ncbi:hypothetical protein WDU94_000302 [Cyamophila willieti]
MADHPEENKEEKPKIEDNADDKPLGVEDNPEEKPKDDNPVERFKTEENLDEIEDNQDENSDIEDLSYYDNLEEYLEKRLNDHLTYLEYLDEMNKLKQYLKEMKKKQVCGVGVCKPGDLESYPGDIVPYLEEEQELDKEGYKSPCESIIDIDIALERFFDDVKQTALGNTNEELAWLFSQYYDIRQTPVSMETAAQYRNLLVFTVKHISRLMEILIHHVFTRDEQQMKFFQTNLGYLNSFDEDCIPTYCTKFIDNYSDKYKETVAAMDRGWEQALLIDQCLAKLLNAKPKKMPNQRQVKRTFDKMTSLLANKFIL